MEVEARMNRNYLPPAIQGGYHQSNQPQTQPVTPKSKNSMKPVLQTIPQGSVMRGSITSGMPITQAHTPYTPSLPQFSPTHGTVVSQTGSIVSGTPISNQESIFSNLPMPNQGSIVSGNPVNQNQDANLRPNSFSGIPNSFSGIQLHLQNQGSIVSGTPINQNQDTTNPRPNSFAGISDSLSAIPDTYSEIQMQLRNQGSIVSGIPVNQNQNSNPRPNSFAGISDSFSGISNSFSGIQMQLQSQGSIVSGTPVNQNQDLNSNARPHSFSGSSVYSGNQVQNVLPRNQFHHTSMFTSIPNTEPKMSRMPIQNATHASQDSIFSSMPNPGSIISGTLMSNTINSRTQSVQGMVMPNQLGSGMSNQGLVSGVPNQGPIVSGMPISNNSGIIISGIVMPKQNAVPNHGSINPAMPINQGSIITGMPIASQGIVSGRPMSNQGSIMSGTPISSQLPSNLVGMQSPLTGMIISNQSPYIPGTSISSQSSMLPMPNQGSMLSSTTIPNQGIISSMPVPNQGSIMTGTPISNQVSGLATSNQSTITGTLNQGSIVSGTPTYQTNSPCMPFSNQLISGTPMNLDSFDFPHNNFNFGSQTSTLPSGSITAGTPLPNSTGGFQGQYSRHRKYSGPQRGKPMLATVQEMAREHAERYSPVRRAELSPPRAAHDIATARLEYRQLQRGLERRGAGATASPPGERPHVPAVSLPGSPIHAGASSPALDLSAICADSARTTQDLPLKIGINLYSPHLPQEVLKSIHSYGSFGLLSGHTSPASPGSPLHQITEGLSYLHTGSITRGTPQANATPLDLRSNVEMDTNYPQLHPMVHPQIHVVAHRSLNNSPISNPSSPLDMIQEEIGNGQHGDAKFLDRTFSNYTSTHPQISLTDCLGSEITLVASSSEDSVDSLENSRYPLPQFVISEPSELDDRPSITKGIGRKVSQDTEHTEPKETDKDAEMQSPKESVDETNKFLVEESRNRRGSDKSLGFSDDSLSNDSANASPNCEQNIQSIYSNIVSISSGFSENRGSFSEHRESFSFSDRGSFSERGDFGRSSFSERSDLGRSSFSEKGETPRSSFSAQGVLEEVKEYYEDVYMPRDDENPPEIEKLQRSTMDLRLSEVCRPAEQKIPILLSPQKVSCVQEYYEVALSTVCSQLDSQRIVELLKETINTRVPPQNIFVETNQTDGQDGTESLTGFLNLEYSGGIQIELVLCENRAKEKKGLKMRRISGDQQEYGKLCQQLITSLTV